ncbi:hypothetical protein SK128_027800 [Halocaridina rubra]|uniref:CHK kinase-like domain-containing protein n=1 Tax=Halocaridina rubra TaxID=373956 RepID=A0AAN8XFK3_HALRR
MSEKKVEEALWADKGSEVTLKSFKIQDFTNKGDNYISFVTTVIVKYTDAGCEKDVSYVVKCNPCSESSGIQNFVAASFEKEVRFYTELVPLLNSSLESIGLQQLKLAKCYAFDLTFGRENLFLNDLRKEGFSMFDRKKGLDKEHMTLVLEELGRFHAASIIAQETLGEPLEIKFDFLNTDFVEMCENSEMSFSDMLGHFISSGVSILEKVGGYSDTINWLNAIKPTACDIFRETTTQKPPFDVVCHGDCWNNNILFRYDEIGRPVDVRLLDLQMYRKASPATDLNYLMYTSLNGPDRKSNLDTYITLYHSSIVKVLKAAKTEVPFDQEGLRQEYHRKNIYGLLMGMMVLPLVVNEGEVPELSKIEKGEMEWFMNNLKEQNIENIDKYPLLRLRMLSMFDEMIEYGVISLND